MANSLQSSMTTQSILAAPIGLGAWSIPGQVIRLLMEPRIAEITPSIVELTQALRPFAAITWTSLFHIPTHTTYRALAALTTPLLLIGYAIISRALHAWIHLVANMIAIGGSYYGDRECQRTELIERTVREQLK